MDDAAARMEAGEVHVWWLDLDAPLTPEEEAALAPDERARAARFAEDADARRFRAARARARAVLAAYAGCAPGALGFDRKCARCGDETHGKPRLVAPADATALRFSASRAGGLGVVAVTRGREVGVDVEHEARARDVALVAEAFFSAAEQAALRAAGSEAEARRRFLDAWSAKEAYLKLRGLGLDAPLARVDTGAWPSPPAWAPDPLPDAGDGFVGLRLDAPEGYAAALALDGRPTPRLRVCACPDLGPRHVRRL